MNIVPCQKVNAASGPSTVKKISIRFYNPTGDGQQKCKRKVRRSLGQDVWRVGNKDSQFRSCGNVNVIESNSDIRNDAQIRKRAEQF